MLNLGPSRKLKSRAGALTLVIDPKHGVPCTVAYALGTRSDPAEAREVLRGCASSPSIASVNTKYSLGIWIVVGWKSCALQNRQPRQLGASESRTSVISDLDDADMPNAETILDWLNCVSSFAGSRSGHSKCPSGRIYEADQSCAGR